MRDKLLESCYTGQRFLQLVSSKTVNVQIGVVLLDDAKRRCDTSCRDA